jgi:hypothetical protein
MSNRNNPRRGDKRRTEHGPRWENPDPGKGCNSTHVAQGRKKWKRIAARSERRNGKTAGGVFLIKHRDNPDPDLDVTFEADLDWLKTGIPELDEALDNGIPKEKLCELP